jgi:hypothetical protein
MSSLSLCMGSVMLAGTETGQSSAQDWQAAVAAAGYRVVGSLYATSTDHSPINEDQKAVIDRSARKSAESVVDQLPRE